MAQCTIPDHAKFTGVMLSRNGCLACEYELVRSERDRLWNALRATEDQLIAVANHVGAKCGDGLPSGAGDTLSAAIIRKIGAK